MSAGGLENGSNWGKTGFFIEVSSIRDVFVLTLEVESTNQRDRACRDAFHRVCTISTY